VPNGIFFFQAYDSPVVAHAGGRDEVTAVAQVFVTRAHDWPVRVEWIRVAEAGSAGLAGRARHGAVGRKLEMRDHERS
jgi:hypothetical protein